MKRIIINILDFLKLKEKIKDILFFIKVNYYQFFTISGIKQTLDYKSIPIIIISFNQLFYLKRLIDFLQRQKYTNIIIIDNNSTYPPLIDYFKTISSTVTIHRLNNNIGHLVFWENQALFNKYSKGYYAVTDADINPDENCPGDFILHFKKILNQNKDITKVGFSLRIDDIPDTNKNKNAVLNWESKFWKNKDTDGNYIALTDTTFSLYRPRYRYEKRKKSSFYHAIRTNVPYIACHGGWYLDNNNLNEEQLFYFKNCNESSSWRIDGNGNLMNTGYVNKSE